MDTIFELEDVDSNHEVSEKVKKEPKIKKKREMSEERKQKLREQLARGRKTLADKRAKKKSETKPAEPKIEKVEKVKTENIKMEVKNNDNDYLRNEITELKKLILEGRKPKEEKKIDPPKIVEKVPVKEEVVKPEPVKTEPVKSAPIPIPQPVKKKRSLLGGGMVLNLNRF